MMQMTSSMPPSIASSMASFAKGAGTKMMDVLAPVAATASFTVLNTGMPLTSCPAFPGEVPPTTLVPYSFIFDAWKLPSRPVIPCTINLVSLLIRILIAFVFLKFFAQFYCLVSCIGHAGADGEVSTFEDGSAFGFVGPRQADDDRNVCLDYLEGFEEPVGNVV